MFLVYSVEIAFAQLKPWLLMTKPIHRTMHTYRGDCLCCLTLKFAVVQKCFEEGWEGPMFLEGLGTKKLVTRKPKYIPQIRTGRSRSIMGPVGDR